MSQVLRPPSVGPIVGHTTATSARLWMRGADNMHDARSVGVAVRFEGGRPVRETATYFRLHREYDRTGTVDFDDLTPATLYTVRMGSLLMDSVDPDLLASDDEVTRRLPAASVWAEDLARLEPELAEARFTTFPAAGGALSFMFGSCRYPGLLLWKKRADEIFHAMKGHLDDPGGRAPPGFVLMVGDQIYADKLHRLIPLERADTPREFHDRYIEAFSSPYIRRLMRSIPTYMILDDHEIEDNWKQNRINEDAKRSLFQLAIHAYLGYQWVHGPRNNGLEMARGDGLDAPGGADLSSRVKRLYYTFEYGNLPFFVLDTRSQRVQFDDAARVNTNHILGYPAKSSDSEFRGQVDVFCDWLARMQKERGDLPKFVVSASVFVPNGVQEIGGDAHRSDSWAAFPTTRRRILKTILESGVQNVVFLCGDVHCSIVAEMTFTSREKGLLPLRAFCITSSAFYWPFPFADGSPLSFVHDSMVEGDGFDVDGAVTMHYRASHFEQDDNFTLVTHDAAKNELHVEVFSRKHEQLQDASLKLG